ncbi:type I-F CRISPR-associated endoribonuclease Cas6/Csy4 [Ferrimonas marina]|nr:type I-F CRISPR-associated endoribonuclease Cas6/Csy4 [Ferrimonas marina]
MTLLHKALGSVDAPGAIGIAFPDYRLAPTRSLGRGFVLFAEDPHSLSSLLVSPPFCALSGQEGILTYPVQAIPKQASWVRFSRERRRQRRALKATGRYKDNALPSFDINSTSNGHRFQIAVRMAPVDSTEVRSGLGPYSSYGLSAGLGGIAPLFPVEMLQHDCQ